MESSQEMSVTFTDLILQIVKCFTFVSFVQGLETAKCLSAGRVKIISYLCILHGAPGSWLAVMVMNAHSNVSLSLTISWKSTEACDAIDKNHPLLV